MSARRRGTKGHTHEFEYEHRHQSAKKDLRGRSLGCHQGECRPLVGDPEDGRHRRRDGAILAAVKAFTDATIGKAMDWLEQKLAAAIPIVIGFLASQVGAPEKSVLRKVLEHLT